MNVMKDLKLRIIVSVLAIAAASACHPDDSDDMNGSFVEDPAYTVISDQTYDFEEFLLDFLTDSPLASSLTDVQKILVAGLLDGYVTGLENELGISGGELGFRRVTYLYESTDQYGKKQDLSAMALWLGKLNGRRWKEISPENICLMEHYTITSDAECPSEGFPFESFINGNSLVIMPDYIGYGATSDMIHPYMNHELCAVNSVDALEAGFELFDELSAADMKTGWQTIVAGASQGGGNALAVHKYMDTRPDLSAKWNFSHSYCAAGPYSPSLTVRKYIEVGKTDHPVLFPLTLKGLRDSYPEILGRFPEERMFSQAYIASKDIIDAALESRQYTTAELNDLCIEYLKTTSDDRDLASDEIYVEDIVSDELLDSGSELYAALFECLEMNDLTEGWTPVHPIKLYYSEVDTVVPADNAFAVRDAFGTGKVTLVKGLPLEHSLSCVFWMLDVLDLY